MSASRPLRLAILRPRLGIGGSERAALDAAVEMQARGHRVVIYAPESQESPQFPEVAERHVEVRTDGAFLPWHVASRLRVPLTIARTLYAALAMARRERSLDLALCDSVPHVIPFVRRLTKAKIAYRCHFPDARLATRWRSLQARYDLYRMPIDRLEEAGFLAADLVFVSSRFTAQACLETFPALASTRLDVLHPGVALPEAPVPVAAAGEALLLSVSRFDPAKNLGLGVETVARLRERLPPEGFATVRLVLAGRPDHRLLEQRRLRQRLEDQVRARDLAAHVTFAWSVTEAERRDLLARCLCVLYTPEAEHFGLVPLEAMAAARSVIVAIAAGPWRRSATAKPASFASRRRKPSPRRWPRWFSTANGPAGSVRPAAITWPGASRAPPLATIWRRPSAIW